MACIGDVVALSESDVELQDVMKTQYCSSVNGRTLVNKRGRAALCKALYILGISELALQNKHSCGVAGFCGADYLPNLNDHGSH